MKRNCKALLFVLVFVLTVVAQPFAVMAEDVQSYGSEYDAAITALLESDNAELAQANESASTQTDTEEQGTAGAEGAIADTSTPSEETGDEVPAETSEPTNTDGVEDSSSGTDDASGANDKIDTTPDSTPDESDGSASADGSASDSNPENTDDSGSETPSPTTDPKVEAQKALEELYKKSTKLKLAYDDRYTFSKSVQKIQTVEITSTQTGTSKKDTSIVIKDSKNGKKVIVRGCGRAVVTLSDGKTYGISAQAAPISLLLIAGQSNSEGSLHKVAQKSTLQKQWIVNEEGQVYNTYAPSSVERFPLIGWYSNKAIALSTKNVKSYIPSSLTDNSSSNQYRRTNNLTNATGARGKSGIDSALGYRWTQLTGEKVWLINAAHGGSSIHTWQPTSTETNNNYWQAVKLYQEAEKLLSKEIAAGHYTLSHKGVFWCQGEADRKMSASVYLKYFRTMYEKKSNGFVATLSGEGIKGLQKEIEFIGILMVRGVRNHTNATDLVMTGPRIAQYYMCGSDSYKLVYLASQAEESWTSNQGVTSYFKSKYKTKAAYLKANPMKNSSPSLPTKVSQIHPAIHYTQLGFNEIGRDVAENICYALGYAKKPTTKVSSIQLVATNGYTNLSNKTISLKNNQKTAFAVKVYPTYLTKGVTVTSSANGQLSYTGSGLTKRGSASQATLTVKCRNKSVALTVKKKK